MDQNGKAIDSDEKSPAGGSPVQDLVLDLNFVPNWARKPAAQTNYYVSKGHREQDSSDDERGARGRPDRQRRPPPRGPRPGRDSRRDDRHSVRGRDERSRDDRFRPRPAPVERAPVLIRFVPEQARLSAVVRQIHLSKKSYPLVELASLFLSRPETCEVRVEVEGNTAAHLYQCKACRMIALERSRLAAHILTSHLGDHFEIEEKLSDPPAGQFVCVAKCGLTGKLLGPPNHHSYAARIHEIHHKHYPGMSLEEYKGRIQMVHDPALIEQWREESRKQVLYRRKGADGEPGTPMKLSEAESLLLREIVPTAVLDTRRAVLSAAVARAIEDPSLLCAVRDAWQKENRFPLTLTLALRGAFRHRHLQVFKAGRGIDFVSAVQPVPLDPEHVVEPIREVLNHLREHPGCTRKDLIEALRPGLAADAPEIKSVLTPLAWLVERGHIIEFFDGTLSVPLPGPRQAPREPAALVAESAT